MQFHRTISALLFCGALTPIAAQAGSGFWAKTVGNDHYIVYGGHDYKLMAPRPGDTWEMVSGVMGGMSDGLSKTACTFTFGSSRDFTPIYTAVEGVMSRGNSYVDMATFAGNDYTYRYLQWLTTIAGSGVYVPKNIANEIERLAADRKGNWFSDYGIIFLLRTEYGQTVVTGCDRYTYVDQYIPTGKALDLNSVGADAWAKAKFGWEVLKILQGMQQQ